LPALVIPDVYSGAHRSTPLVRRVGSKNGP
jgi:hypothetical protein